MKIEIDIPDEFAERQLTLVAGQRELAAFKLPNNDYWEIKIVRCNNCGDCCMGLCWKKEPYNPDKDGKCSKLKKEGTKWMCSAMWETPLRCLSDPSKEVNPICCIEYERQYEKK